MQYEYRILRFSFTKYDTEIEQSCNEFGSAGWRLISVFHDRNEIVCIFMRER